MTLTYHTYRGGQGVSPYGMGPAIAKACAAIRADRSAAFMREAKAFARSPRPGSWERLRELIGQYRTERWARSRHQRVLIVAEILKLKRSRISADVGINMMAAE